MAKIKVLPCEILKSHFGDCSNGGMSSKYDEVYLIHPEGFLEVEDTDPRLVILEKRKLWGEKHYFIRPVVDVPSGNVGYMASGCFIHTSDSRFSNYCETSYAIPFHDRTETQKEYDMLSH